MPKFAANLSMLFTDVPIAARFAAAVEAGFTEVEMQFPYAWDKALLSASREKAGVSVVLHNLPAGDWDAGERGIACIPGRESEFREGVELAIEYAKALGAPRLNCLAGIKPASVCDEQAWLTLVGNLRYAAKKLDDEGIVLTLEAINSLDVPGFLIDSTEKALRAIQLLGVNNIKYQYDIYHMQVMEGDLVRTIKRHLANIGHIQFADNPGRHQPGTGEINFAYIFSQLDEMGYQGWVSAEYIPLGNTRDTLGWLQ
ncbi:hydroxypyruvate isomerase [Hahella sp. KA22]|uniref:hydroxypyruvate isomerase n=1 Tax=Hahella sp. KA22 TaxID=1628392 RepID=UPI000FDD6BE6|nr:hydroxypyruvate isomerase [Hahella sp. KA22]AZZ90096.1 hydroxypyruvate isomerase [Hahella sp. KA22]QAY53466.1 hydroxypyruvate isomerase [Hahella sp. KA22]